MRSAAFSKAAFSAGALCLVSCTTTTTTVPICPTTLSFPAALVYPVPSATRVPANIGSIVVQGGFHGTVSSLTVISAQNGLLTQSIIGPPPAPLPSPLATLATVAAYPLGSIPVPVLASYTTYGVTLVENFAANPTCPAVNVQLGYFTTAL
jgi:hypothetical protein